MEQRGDFSEFRKGWHLVAVGLLGVALGMPGLPFYTIGIFAPIFAKEFGWLFANIFGGLAIMTAAMLFVGPFAGMLIDKFGARRVAPASLLFLGASYMTLAASNGSLVLYYMSWTAIAVFGLGATPVAFTQAVNSAFVKRRGLALGIVLAGTGLFAFAVKPLAQLLVDEASWRVAILAMGAMPALIAAPAVLWGFARMGNRNAAGGVGTTPRVADGMTVREVIRSRPFWLLAAVFVPMSLAVAAPLPNIENILRSLRLSRPEIVQLASMVGASILIGRIMGGLLIDRFWAPAVGCTVLAMGAVACFSLSLDAVSFVPAFAAIMLLGLTAGIEYDLMAYLVARYLGMRSYGTAYATLFGIFAVGAGLGPSLFGYVFDRTGTYSGILEICALLLVADAVVILFLGPYPSHRSAASD
ncbi:putative MFS family arabinose efflux permease [Chelatococcus asaccharovorans]|nr:putative MFS family arabinose efflux permease [Chelatococcus asaccharovorans]CAH1679828.1 putative MFS family arabinose efflux permease [Chelatococcus asaccharovorans]